MKLADIIIFSLCVVFFIIGVHQAMVLGLTHAYWIFMLCAALLMFYKVRKQPEANSGTKEGSKAKMRKEVK